MDAIQELKKMLISETPILFLGAGFSIGSSNGLEPVPTGNRLKDQIVDDLLKDKISTDDYNEVITYNLQDICQHIYSVYGSNDELKDYLIRRFKNLVPDDFHYKLTSYDWKKIYTVNIDDLVEKIYDKCGKELIVQNEVNEITFDNGTEYIKLHGCVNKPSGNFIFSRDEYTNLINKRLDFKLNNLVTEIQKENFIFVGASLDEIDIDFYLTQYKNAGYVFKKGRIIFIDPYPSLKLKTRIKELGGYLIEWDTKQFLDYVEDLKYNPKEIERQKKLLNYKGIFNLSDIKGALEDSEVYESRLYEGFSCSWKDVFEGWLFTPNDFAKISKEIDDLTYNTSNIYCISLYGNAFCGKSCLLKLVGNYLLSKSYDVLEYKGKYLDIQVLIKYILTSPSEYFALLIDSGSYYYNLIEKLYDQKIYDKKLLIVTTSREYYHTKKRYYLEGHEFNDFRINSNLSQAFARVIKDKLEEKGYLGYLASLPSAKVISEITKKKELVNLMTELTYGEGFKRKIDRAIYNMRKENKWENKLFVELAIFDKADLPYYPSEMLTMKYRADFDFYYNGHISKLSNEQAIIIDYIKIEEQGIALRNNMFIEQILHDSTETEKINAIKDILLFIAPYVSERINNNWRIIFESLTKEDILEKSFLIKSNSISKLYYSLRNEYKKISYYWLQLGIVEQKLKDYTKALSHLQMAESIRPNAYQIQHAIARNYLKHANYISKSALSEQLFKEGEKRMLDLINSKEYYKQKAKAFSIHCYITEKIHFIKSEKCTINDKELEVMKRYIEDISDSRDVYVQGLANSFYKLLVGLGKESIIRIKIGDLFYKAIQNDFVGFNYDDDMDLLTETL